MATTTENLGMTLPDTTDPVDVTVLNGNFSAIDTFAGQQTAKDTSQDARMTAIENDAADLDDRLTALETKDNAQDAAIAAKLNTADVDDALSSTSTNPVQNKVVYAELESIKASARVLTLDTTTFTSLAAYADTFGNGTHSVLVPNNNTLPDVPMNNANAIVKITVYSASAATMEFWPISSAWNGKLFTQIKSAGIWRGWYKFEGTVVN